MGRFDPRWTDAQRSAVREQGEAGIPLREVQRMVAAGELRDETGEPVPGDMPANTIKGFWGKGRKRARTAPALDAETQELIDHLERRLVRLVARRMATLEEAPRSRVDPGEYVQLARTLSTLRKETQAKRARAAPAPAREDDFVTILARKQARKAREG